MTDSIASVGFVGLGDMGAKQAREIAKLPVSLTVFDVREEAMAPFAGTARLASSLAEAGTDADLVGLCVQTDDQVRDCAAALLPAMKAGSVLLIHATVRPETVIGIAKQAEEFGVIVRDAPVTRTRMVQDGPFVFCPMGGDEAVKARIQPILDSFATDTLLVGPIGSAMALKICNNLVSWCEIVVALEAVALAQAAGIAPDKLLTLMGTNGLLTPPMKIFAEFRGNPRDDEGWRRWVTGAAGQGEKDLALAEELAREHGADAPMASFARAIVQRTVAAIAEQR